MDSNTSNFVIFPCQKRKKNKVQHASGFLEPNATWTGRIQGNIATFEASSKWPNFVLYLRLVKPPIHNKIRAQKTPWHACADVVVYSSAITACEKNHEWKTALEVFEHMENAGSDLQMDFLRPFRECHVKHDCRCEVMWGIRPNAVTYAACISACGRHSDWRQAEIGEIGTDGIVEETRLVQALHFLTAAHETGHRSTIACNVRSWLRSSKSRMPKYDKAKNSMNLQRTSIDETSMISWCQNSRPPSVRVRMGMNGRPAFMTFYVWYFREENELMQGIERWEC